MRISDWSSDVCSSDLHGAEADILAGEVDFFVGPFQAESTTRSLRVETLFENRRSVIAREGHPLANATSLSDLRDARWVRPSFSDSRDEADFDEVFERAKLPPPNVVLHTRSAMMTLLAVAHSDLPRSEEHTSELHSLMRISYAVFCLKKKNTNTQTTHQHYHDIT